MSKTILHIVIEGTPMEFRLDPEPSSSAATCERDDGIVWCHPTLWKYLNQICDLSRPSSSPVAGR